MVHFLLRVQGDAALDQIQKYGTIVYKSKTLSGIVAIECDDESVLESLKQITGVIDIQEDKADGHLLIDER